MAIDPRLPRPTRGPGVRPRQRPSLAPFVAVLILGSACTGCEYFPAAPNRLDGTQWRVVEVDGIGPLPGTEPVVRFVAGQVQGSTGCNDFGGPFALTSDGVFSVGELTTTSVSCEGPLARQEAMMLDALRAAKRVSLEEGRLSIDGPSGRLELAEGMGSISGTSGDRPWWA